MFQFLHKATVRLVPSQHLLFKTPVKSCYVTRIVGDGNRIRWFGHVMRMQDTRLPKKIFTLELTGRRPIGRPRTRWRDQVKQDLERRGPSSTDVTSKSLWNDREHWRRISNTRPP